MTFDSFYKNVMALDAESLILEAAASREGELADANVENLENHKLSNGNPIKPDYSPTYAEFKGFKVPDLEVTGDHHSGVFADVQGDGIVFDSTDWKSDKLTDKYTVDIYGTTERQLVEIIDADVVDLINKKITK
jgi:hypothetical protein